MNMMQYFYHWLSGNRKKVVIEDIRSMEAYLRKVELLNLKYDNYWLKWFGDLTKDFLVDYIKLVKITRYLPNQVIPKNYKKAIIDSRNNAHINALNKITENGRIVCNSIVLPAYEKEAGNDQFFYIVDSLFTYLLDNLDNEDVYSLFSDEAFGMLEGPYEYKSVCLEKGDTVIDAGSNIGEFSALAGGMGCNVYAFEPISSVIESYLSKTAQWNPNITLCPYALSDKRGELTFDVDLINLGWSSSVIERKSSSKIKVEAIDLDSFAEEHKLTSIDFIKADIEGSERDMLKGARGVLKEFAPKIAICKYHLPDDPKVLRQLILDANPDYLIEERWKKMYAYVPKK